MNKLRISNKIEKALQIIIISKKRSNAFLKEFKLSVDTPFKAEKNEFYVLNENKQTYFLIGIGDETQLSEIRKIAKKFSWEWRKKIDNSNFQIHFPAEFNEKQIENFLIGFWYGTYEINHANKEEFVHPFWNEKNTLFLSPKDSKFNLKKIAEKAQKIVEGQFLGMDLLNLPPNKKNSEILADFVENLAEENQFSCKVMDKKQCEKEGLHAFLSVNQGSSFQPAFMILEYKPAKPKKKVGLVGKCVTFDTGGISIKPSDNMHYMKSDMGGATTVLGAFYTAVKLNLPIHLIAILPATDNAVSSSAYLPGDVIDSYSGKTIEVINTDAEGRMTLADGLAYMEKNYSPDVMLDLATLTGSAVRTFGYKCCAFFTENDKLKNTFEKIGNEIGEKVWQLPLWDEYLDDLKSDVADYKHISLSPMSDVIYAAKFLQQFTNEHKAWAHLDIAGVAFGNNDYSKDKSATGYGVQLLVEVLENL